MQETVIAIIVGGIGIIFGLVSYFRKVWVDRELDALKTALQIRAAEREFRPANLHEKRAEKLGDVYRHIAELSITCERYINQLGQMDGRQGFSELGGKLSDLHLFFETTQIYLPELADEAAQREKNETFVAAVKAFEAEIPALKKALKDEFRKIAGVER